MRKLDGQMKGSGRLDRGTEQMDRRMDGQKDRQKKDRLMVVRGQLNMQGWMTSR